MNDVSIIIPCYNHGDKITKTINSCNLIHANKEIIVVNDGSTDNTKDIIVQFPNIRLINQENHGVGNARNVGISICKYNNIITIDADDEFLIGVNKLLNYINEYDLIYGNVFNSTGYLHRLLPETALNNILFEQQNPMTSVFLFKKYVWLSIGGFSENRDIFEDWDFVAKAFYKNFKFKYIDTDVFIYNRYNNGRLANQLKNHHFHKTLTLESINGFKNK